MGKSTLLNALMGYKLAIATEKAQTTRHRIFGILNGEDYQMIFSDTPGIIKPAYKLQESMMNFVNESMVDGDVVLLMVEAGQKELGEEVEEKLRRTQAPIVLVLNKIDKLSQDEVLEWRQYWLEKMKVHAVVPLSALNKFNTKELLELLISLMPESPAYYDKDQITDKPERFFASELIREKIFLRYKKEIPYASEVVITAFNESSKLIKIHAEILVERESQKGILIGERGVALKNVGIAARKDLENFFQKQVFLEMFVKVKANWRNEDKMLKEFGYDG